MNRKIAYSVDVKFRAFGMDFGRVSHSGSVALPFNPAVTVAEDLFLPGTHELVSFSGSGVQLKISIE